MHRTKLAHQENTAVVQILRDQIQQKVYPVHRLDRATSGVLLMALSPEAAQNLAFQFSGRMIEKKYWAIVRGFFNREIFLDYSLTHEKKEKPAQTFFKPLSKIELLYPVDRYPTSRYSLVEAHPKTGRTHQIRKHLKHLNHPIMGDVNYGSGKHNRFFSQELGIKRLLLMCREICFQHPRFEERVQIMSPLCSDFKEALVKLGFKELNLN